MLRPIINMPFNLEVLVLIIQQFLYFESGRSLENLEQFNSIDFNPDNNGQMTSKCCQISRLSLLYHTMVVFVSYKYTIKMWESYLFLQQYVKFPKYQAINAFQTLEVQWLFANLRKSIHKIYFDESCFRRLGRNWQYFMIFIIYQNSI